MQNLKRRQAALRIQHTSAFGPFSDFRIPNSDYNHLPSAKAAGHI